MRSWEPDVNAADLEDAADIMSQWDAAIGNSAATWSCLETIAKRGGLDTSQGPGPMYVYLAANEDFEAVSQRPWRWWTEAARVAQTQGDHFLVARIFLFMGLFTISLAPKHSYRSLTEAGLVPPDGPWKRKLTELAISSLGELDPGMTLQDTSAGRVDVALALTMAKDFLERFC